MEATGLTDTPGVRETLVCTAAEKQLKHEPVLSLNRQLNSPVFPPGKEVTGSLVYALGKRS